jgi:hypothetical protein
MLSGRVVGDADVMHCSVATAHDDRESIRKNRVDERRDRLSFRLAVRTHKNVAVGMPLVTLKSDGQIAARLVHNQDERPVRTCVTLTHCHAD